MFKLEEIVEDIANVNALFYEARIREFCHEYGVRPDRDKLMQHRRPEDFKAQVLAVLPRRVEWNTATLCAELGIKRSVSTATSLALVLRELGWTSKKRTSKRVVHFRKSWPKPKLARAASGV